MNPIRRVAVGALLAVATGGLSACLLPPDAPTVLASATGTGPDDAYVVYSAEQEHEVLRLLGLRVERRAVHMIDGRTFDVFTTTKPETGEARDVWFDISRFFGRL